MERLVTTRLSRRNIARLIAGSAAVLSIGCGANPTEPVSRNIQSTSVVRHDDDPNNPPTDPCRGGWVLDAGHWVCNG